MKTIAVIPARYGSTRFPGKPLAKILGKEMILWVIEGALQAKLVDEILVATDHQEIFDLVRSKGFHVEMTDSDLPSGTDRVFVAAQRRGADLVINVQGDEPLIKGAMIDTLVKPMLADPKLSMGTLAHSILRDELESINAVKVIVNVASEAIYFSRFPIPYSKGIPTKGPYDAVLKHVGMYAYRMDFLEKFCAAPQSRLELAESLEQLRAIEMGARIKVVAVQERSWGVDSPEDLARIEEHMGKNREKKN